jgi:streptogramin lyase
MIERRHFLSLAAAVPAAAALPKSAKAAALVSLAGLPVHNIATTEIAYKTPRPKPNGLDLNAEGMWSIDQGPENYVTVFNPATGATIREFTVPSARAASGICIDDDGSLWIGSTYNRFIIKADSRTGALIQKYQTPGAGIIYRVRGEAPGRRTPLPDAYPNPPPPAGAAPPAPRPAPLPPGHFPADMPESPAGTGAHSILVKGNLLYVAVPPARMIYVIDKNTWEVVDMWRSAGNRPHDMSWSDSSRTKIWSSDSNSNNFVLYDVSNGRMLEQIKLPDTSGVIHGAKVYNGYMYCADDVGWMFRFRMPT